MRLYIYVTSIHPNGVNCGSGNAAPGFDPIGLSSAEANWGSQAHALKESSWKIET